MSLPKSIQFLVLGGHTLLPSNPSEQCAQQPLQNIETEYHPTPGFTLFLQFCRTSYAWQTQPEWYLISLLCFKYVLVRLSCHQSREQDEIRWHYEFDEFLGVHLALYKIINNSSMTNIRLALWKENNILSKYQIGKSTLVFIFGITSVIYMHIHEGLQLLYLL